MIPAPSDTPAESLVGAGVSEGADPPRLALAGYDGPLDRLLDLARAERIDLAALPLGDLLDQLLAALAQAAPLAAKGDWVVMASWLLLLRSRLLLPDDTPAQRAAEDTAEDLRARLLRLGEARALATWLDRRPQPGQDFFVRARGLAQAVAPPETGDLAPPMLAEAAPAEPGPAGEEAIDVIEFLWSCMALFDDDLPAPETAPRYRPLAPDLHSIVAARARILRRLAAAPAGVWLAALLPDEGDGPVAPAGAPAGAPGADGKPSPRRRSAWSSTFVAGLELARQGAVSLAQTDAFGAIHVAPARAPADGPPPGRPDDAESP